MAVAPAPIVLLALYRKQVDDRSTDARRGGGRSPEGHRMKPSVRKLMVAAGLVIIGVAIAAAGIYVGDTDDAPGASLMGILLMIAAVVLAIRTARRKT
jgi:hypothetical protein